MTDYLHFNAQTLKDKIHQDLNEKGLFTDQAYVGSYISTINEIIAYSYQTLLFYLNQTSSESIFTESQLYENMSRIVKLLDYKPTGYQAATVSFVAFAQSDLPVATHVIPRYAYVKAGNVPFSINKDIFVHKQVEGSIEELKELQEETVLLQGIWNEYPLLTATGNPEEIFRLMVPDNTFIDHFNIHAYVKEPGGKWVQWNRVYSLYMSSGEEESFEVLFNENKRYELRFGDGIQGKALKEGSQIAIFYLNTQHIKGKLAAHSIENKALSFFDSPSYQEILQDTQRAELISVSNIKKILFTNLYESTDGNEHETVDHIRQNAPGLFRTQYRLLTSADYEVFLRSNYHNILKDVKVLTNKEYLDQHLKYAEELGLSQPSYENNILYAQVNYSDSCGYNNVYLYLVPRNGIYCNKTQKDLILQDISEMIPTNIGIVFQDPVYMDFQLGIYSGEGKLYIRTQGNLDASLTKNLVAQTILDFFKTSDFNYFNKEWDLNQLKDQILHLPGIVGVETREEDTRISGLSFIVQDHHYPQLKTPHSHTIQLKEFQIGQLQETVESLLDKIIII